MRQEPLTRQGQHHPASPTRCLSAGLSDLIVTAALSHPCYLKLVCNKEESRQCHCHKLVVPCPPISSILKSRHHMHHLPNDTLDVAQFAKNKTRASASVTRFHEFTLVLPLRRIGYATEGKENRGRTIGAYPEKRRCTACERAENNILLRWEAPKES